MKKAPLGKTQSVAIPSQNLAIDPRGKSSFRGKGVYIAKGDTVTVKGTKALRADKKPVKATWY
jgi:lipopolysaccharide export system protein LptA